MLRGFGYRCFGDTWRPHIQGSSSPSQITGAEAWNLANESRFFRKICCVNWKNTAGAYLWRVWTQRIHVHHFLMPKRKECGVIHSCTNLFSESVHTSTTGPLLYQKNLGTGRKVSSHFEYLENLSRGLDVTRQPVRGDLTVHLLTFTLPWG